MVLEIDEADGGRSVVDLSSDGVSLGFRAAEKGGK